MAIEVRNSTVAQVNKILSDMSLSENLKFREISAREIELSGINVMEFNSFLENYGAVEVFDCAKQLENL